MPETTPRPRDELPRSVHHQSVRRCMQAVRDAFRHQRLAQRECLLYGFYVEHNLREEAAASRANTLGLLRHARQNWRIALGLS